MTVAIALPTVPQLTIAQQGVKFVHALSLANSTQYEWPWSSLVEGDEGCIGPSGKLLCFWQTEKNIQNMHGNVPRKFDCCSSPSTKELQWMTQVAIGFCKTS